MTVQGDNLRRFELLSTPELIAPGAAHTRPQERLPVRFSGSRAGSNLNSLIATQAQRKANVGSHRPCDQGYALSPYHRLTAVQFRLPQVDAADLSLKGRARRNQAPTLEPAPG